MKKLLCNVAVVIAAILGVVSCENDLSPIGADLLGEDPAGVIKEAVFDVKTYSVPVNPVQTSNFSSFPFGTYDDPIYGESTYEFVSQINLNSPNPDIGNNTELIDVRLEIPYYSTITGVDEDGTNYLLDSIYGNEPLKLEMYRSNYFLSSFDVGDLSDRAIYYSNFKTTIENNLGELLYTLDGFTPSSEEIRISAVVDGVPTEEILERQTPRLRETLTPDNVSLERWKEILFNLDTSNGDIVSPRSELANNSLFQNYFRGLYFKVASVTGNGNLIHFNLNQASIIVTIQSDSDIIDVDDIDEDGDTTDFIANPESQIVIGFNGNKVGLIDNQIDPTVLTEIQNSNDPVNGAENIYLKGGPGALAVVELFGQATNAIDGEAPALSQVIANDWLINDAYIEFYVDQSKFPSGFPGSKEPERILIYDYETNRLLSDFVLSSSTDALNNNLNHLGRLERIDPDDGLSSGVKYKIRLTQHLNNIIAGNNPNNRLAIVVSQNVSLFGNSSVLNTVSPNADMEFIPIGAAISHEGTILHGNLAQGSAGEFIEKRPRLTIRYSETN
ncbi:MAG: DUF4270 domain-containing protein [Nonlabens sp.]|uniref:DUF4270 domain-containing protein n=1 Tax=Nonlabens sp. TaxID=1888209 RepID=UPI00321C2A11